jgi:hypothetical protein
VLNDGFFKNYQEFATHLVNLRMFLICCEYYDWRSFANFFSLYFLLELKITKKENFNAAVEKILVPTDCSIHSRISLLCASRLATEFGASVTLLYVEKHAEQKKQKKLCLSLKIS